MLLIRHLYCWPALKVQKSISQVIVKLYILSTGRDKVTRILVKNTSVNVNVNKKCFQGFTPLLAASMAGFRFCVKVIKSQYFSFCLNYTFYPQALLSSKSLNLQARWQGMTAETLAQRNGHKKIEQILKVESVGFLIMRHTHF